MFALTTHHALRQMSMFARGLSVFTGLGLVCQKVSAVPCFIIGLVIVVSPECLQSPNWVLWQLVEKMWGDFGTFTCGEPRKAGRGIPPTATADTSKPQETPGNNHTRK